MCMCAANIVSKTALKCYNNLRLSIIILTDSALKRIQETFCSWGKTVWRGFVF